MWLSLFDPNLLGKIVKRYARITPLVPWPNLRLGEARAVMALVTNDETFRNGPFSGFGECMKY